MVKLRDRDAPVASGLIFRVYGDCYHPRDAWICDVEYAHESIYHTDEPKAVREINGEKYYKFYADGGLEFVKNNFPQYLIFYEPLQTFLVGVKKTQSFEIRKTDECLQRILSKSSSDKLLYDVRNILTMILENSSLEIKDFGVFGSLMHDFYHPSFSDIDFVIYGRKGLNLLRETLSDLYSDQNSLLKNEFSSWNEFKRTKGHIYFKNYSLQEFYLHEKRKLIWAIYKSNRDIKVEFEPVRSWKEINECVIIDECSRIKKEGWIKATGTVLDASDSFFIPSVYEVEIDEIFEGPKDIDICRIISFVEEYRGQLVKDEIFLVEGNLEKIEHKNRSFHQITLSYGPNYYNQVLKLKEINNLEI